MKSATQAVVYAVILADLEPADPIVFLPDDITEAPRDNVPLADRDGNQYVGRMVQYGSYTEASQCVRDAYQSGTLHDGTSVPSHGLVIVGLAMRPKSDATLKFSPA